MDHGLAIVRGEPEEVIVPSIEFASEGAVRIVDVDREQRRVRLLSVGSFRSRCAVNVKPYQKTCAIDDIMIVNSLRCN